MLSELSSTIASFGRSSSSSIESDPEDSGTLDDGSTGWVKSQSNFTRFRGLAFANNCRMSVIIKINNATRGDLKVCLKACVRNCTWLMLKIECSLALCVEGGTRSSDPSSDAVACCSQGTWGYSSLLQSFAGADEASVVCGCSRSRSTSWRSTLTTACSHNGWSNVTHGISMFNSFAWFTMNSGVDRMQDLSPRLALILPSSYLFFYNIY